MSDEDFMALALAQARQAALLGEVPVGAVIVRHGEVIAVGCNAMIGTHDPTAHAEIVALRAAAMVLGNYRLHECELFVTLEPCAMCSGALLNARLKRVVYGACEPKTGAAGSVINLFAQAELNHHTQVQGGVLLAQSRALMQDFFRQRRLTLRKESGQSYLLREDALRTPDAAFHGLSDYPWQPHYLNDLPALEGLRIHYLDEQGVSLGQGGDSLTYLFLHSATGWSYDFRHFLPSLISAGHRLIVPDLIGFGKSDKPKKEAFHTFSRHRQILIELIEKLDLKNIVLVVSEANAWLSLALPMSAPKRYRSLQILDTGLANGNLPISARPLLWEKLPAHIAGNGDTVLPYLRSGKQMCIDDNRDIACHAPFPDQGHRAAIRAFARMAVETEITKYTVISDEVSRYWREQMAILKVNGD